MPGLYVPPVPDAPIIDLNRYRANQCALSDSCEEPATTRRKALHLCANHAFAYDHLSQEENHAQL